MKDITLGKAALWPAELAPRFLGSTSKEVAKSTLTVVHGLTYLPLLLLPVLQDVHLKLVVVINTALCLCLMAGNTLFHFMGIVKVGLWAPVAPAVPHLLQQQCFRHSSVCMGPSAAVVGPSSCSQTAAFHAHPSCALTTPVCSQLQSGLAFTLVGLPCMCVVCVGCLAPQPPVAQPPTSRNKSHINVLCCVAGLLCVGCRCSPRCLICSSWSCMAAWCQWCACSTPGWQTGSTWFTTQQ